LFSKISRSQKYHNLAILKTDFSPFVALMPFANGSESALDPFFKVYDQNW